MAAHVFSVVEQRIGELYSATNFALEALDSKPTTPISGTMPKFSGKVQSRCDRVPMNTPGSGKLPRAARRGHILVSVGYGTGYDSEDSEDTSDTLTFAQTLQKQGDDDELMIPSCSNANNIMKVVGGGRLKSRNKAKKILAQVKAGDADAAAQLKTLERSFRKRHLKRYDTSNMDILNQQIGDLQAALENADHNENQGKATTAKLQRLQSEKTMRLEIVAQRKAERRRTAEYDRNNPKGHRDRCAKADKATRRPSPLPELTEAEERAGQQKVLDMFQLPERSKRMKEDCECDVCYERRRDPTTTTDSQRRYSGCLD
ncbi:unnamed protein product [Sphagnum balticum]